MPPRFLALPCAAEFNFHADPEAARLVLHKFATITMVTWEATQRFFLPWRFIDGRYLGAGTQKSAFMAGACTAPGHERTRPLGMSAGVCLADGRKGA